jgi:hypothetical protein
MEDEDGIKEKETERLAKLHESNCRWQIIIKQFIDSREPIIITQLIDS